MSKAQVKIAVTRLVPFSYNRKNLPRDLMSVAFQTNDFVGHALFNLPNNISQGGLRLE